MYQTLQVSNQLPFIGGPSTRGSTMEAGVKLFAKAVKALNGYSLSYKVTHEIEKKKAEVLQAIQGFEATLGQSYNEVGALLVVGLQEWSTADAAGDKLKSFMDVFIAGAGLSAADVYEHYVATPKLTQGAPKGWTRQETYTWATRSHA